MARWLGPAVGIFSTIAERDPLPWGLVPWLLCATYGETRRVTNRDSWQVIFCCPTLTVSSHPGFILGVLNGLALDINACVNSSPLIKQINLFLLAATVPY